MIPYIINVNEDREEPSKAGLEVTVLHTIAKKMNFKENYLHCPHPSWGSMNEDTGKYTYMFGSMFDNETDIIAGNCYRPLNMLVQISRVVILFIYLHT